MPKVGMEDLRRRQLIAATITSIHEQGFANATISRISKNAGLSGGIVAHYFDDKAGLLAATMRSLAQDLLRETVRSEEHTSELQSLMRISYAVFCLKKKTQQQRKTRRRQQP